MSLATVETFDKAAVLKTLNLNPSDPHTQALLLICQRYDLDPLMKHVVLITGRPYITRDGYLDVAHKSGVFDGIEIVEEGETETHWWARASVHRKDMTRPFTYRGRYPKKGGNKEYGPEMAVKCAEVMSLRRAFNVTGAGAADERWDDDSHERINPAIAADLSERLNALGGDARKKFFEVMGNRRPQDLRADDEADALALTAELEAEAAAEVVGAEVVEDPDATQVPAEADITGELDHLLDQLGDHQRTVVEAYVDSQPVVDENPSRATVLEAIRKAEALRSHTGPIDTEAEQPTKADLLADEAHYQATDGEA